MIALFILRGNKSWMAGKFKIRKLSWLEFLEYCHPDLFFHEGFGDVVFNP